MSNNPAFCLSWAAWPTLFKRFLLALSLGSLFLGPSAVWADDRSTCHDQSAEPEAAITACNRAIAFGQFRGNDLKQLYVDRATRWTAKLNAENAWNDSQEALRLDPTNADLLNHAFYAAWSAGVINEAMLLGDRILQRKGDDADVHLVIGVRAFEQKQYQAARAQFVQSARGPISELTGTLLAAWALAGMNDTRGAISTLDRLTGPDWYASFKNLHAGLILDLAGNKAEAGKRLEAAYKLDPKALRVSEAYGRWAQRNLGKQEALKVFQSFNEALPNHPLISQEMDRVKNGEPLSLLIDSPEAGAAEALYGLGAALARSEEKFSLTNRGLMYLQLALHLSPQHDLALATLAELHEAMKNPQIAINVYGRVPERSAIKRNATIRSAIDLDSIGRTEDAKRQLEGLIDSRPDDPEAIMALGNILRDRKEYAKCADVYSKAVALLPKPERVNWTFFYFRGICYERAKEWPKAEADLKKALELFPDQPLVLNYLGYSWVDQGVNLDAGMRMIKRSVEQRPDDGYIVDSLGWSYYRVGRYEEAVTQLERAAQLLPTDPTILSHLGDVYWRLGRKGDAVARWSRAKDLKPEADNLASIEAKLRSGLQDSGPTEVTASPNALQGSVDVWLKAREATDAPDEQKVTLYQKSKALVIGIDHYDGRGWPILSNGIKDAEEIARGLTVQGFQVTIRKDLKSDELDRALKTFFIYEGSASNTRLLLWFAGHGYTLNGEGYIVPADAPSPKDEPEFRDKAISLRRFGEYMREANAKHVLAVFDSCFSGSVFNVARSLPPPAITLATTQPVREFISSGEAEQQVSDDGTFRKLFLDVLAGKEPDADANHDGYVTGTELGLFLHQKMTNLTNNRQTPRYGKLNALGYDRGDFVFQVGKPNVPVTPAAQAR
jgi:tetratricopeptide (TPR) repeat protein